MDERLLNFHLSWSPAAGMYIATCTEFPTLYWTAATRIDALEGIEGLVRAAIDDGEPAYLEDVPRD